MNHKLVSGFYKLNRSEKINLVAESCGLSNEIHSLLDTFLHTTNQELFNEFSENTVSNFYLPYSIAPNFLINNVLYFVPMVIEESSVVAAASKAASFWAKNGGFKFEIVDTEKVGQLFFEFDGDYQSAHQLFNSLKPSLIAAIQPFEERMKTRGGGLRELILNEHQPHLGNLYEIQAHFQTADSMGANFINSCLEAMKEVLNLELIQNKKGNVVMAILSNYTPNCLVRCWVECPIEALGNYTTLLDSQTFAKRFSQAVHLATTDVYRATTHNKGIFNGIDAVVLATGNDFRAIEAGAHAFASKTGKYQSLTKLELTPTTFKYTLELPLALGTVGGLTSLHPLAKTSLQILQNPSAQKLMGIAAAVGLANNFSAVSSLITSGIQSGHMKMHLQNILNTFNATPSEKESALLYFSNQTVSYALVQEFITKIRTTND